MNTKVTDQTRSIVSAQTVTTTTTFASLTRGIYVGVDGDLPVVFGDDTEATFEAATNGYHPLQVKSIGGTGLTATGVVALF
jgi:hypothetical protein